MAGDFMQLAPLKTSPQQSTTQSRMVKLVNVDPEDKGDAIRFRGGKYAGLTGWMDVSYKTQPPIKFHVIVDKGKGKGFYTCVDQKSVGIPFQEPKSQLDSAVQQVAAIEKHLGALCSTLVKCQINKVTPELIALLAAKLNEAVDAHKGTKSRPALCYDIDLWNDNFTVDEME
jgi:hypothetical protein